MLTRQETERLAQAVNALRPDWPTASLVTFIWKRNERPLLDLSVELTWVAQLTDSKSPARIDQDGPWKKATIGSTGQVYRQIGRDECIICGFSDGWALHTGDHDFENPLMRRKSALPTPEQKAALEAARIEAEKKLTAAREAEPSREVRDPAEVIASHLTEENA